MIKNNSINYGIVTKILHWVMAVFICLIFSIGYIMTTISKSPIRSSLYDFHKATGLMVFSLFFIRLAWQAINIQPKPPNNISKPVKLLAKYNRILLYLLMMTLPLSGFLISVLGGHRVSIYNLFIIQPFITHKALSSLFSSFHQLLVYTLAIAFFLHVTGALYHHFIRKDNVLKRMWFNKKGGQSPC